VTGSCPKHMVMGPCGGVRADGRCEVVPDPCELQRRFGHTPQLAAATGQSHRIGHLLEAGQLASQVLLLTRE
jgi:hypothetical protein